MPDQGDWARIQMTSMAYQDHKLNLQTGCPGMRKCHHTLFLKNSRTDKKENIIKIIASD